MKNLLIRLGLGLIGFLFIYLLVAFYSISFNISTWDPLNRFMCVLLGGFVCLGVATFPYDNLDD